MLRRTRGWRTTRIRRLKYNFENRFTSCGFTSADSMARGILIPGDAVAGVRKMAFLRGTMSLNLVTPPTKPTVSEVSDEPSVAVIPPNNTFYSGTQTLVAIVYLPEGFDLNSQSLNVTSPTPGSGGFTSITSDCYVPSQNLLWCGIIDSYMPTRFRVPINKNLNANDQIVVLARSLSQASQRTTILNIQYTYSMAYR